MRLLPLALCSALAFGSGCGPKVVRESVYKSEIAEVRLRHVEEGGAPVPREFEHPVTIAPVRVAHILASLSYEDREGKPHPVIRNAHVYPLAEGIGEALGRATPDDEVIAYARSRDRRLGIFSVDRITAFGVHMASSQLVLEFYAVEHRLEELEKEGRRYDTPLELPEGRGSFRLLPGRAQAAAGPRTLAVDWRNPQFRRPLGLRRGGGLRRRTVLMEAEELEEEGDAEQELGTPPARAPQPSTTDAQLRALDQLEAVRRAGLVSEVEFQRRRRLVLEGRLAEAGYGTDPP